MSSAKNALMLVLLAGIALVSFGATSHAANAVHATDGSLWDLLQPVYDAFVGHQYWYAGSLTVVVAAALTKRYLGDRVPWLHTDAGGATLTLVGSFAGATAASLAGGVAMSWDIATNALKIAVAAAGGYTVVKHLIITPLLVPLIARSPEWLQKILRSVAWIFDGTPEAPPVDSAPAA